MLRKLRQRLQDEKGFTLIELLVVVLIVGILAAIALPMFLGQESKAKDASAKSNARTRTTSCTRTARQAWSRTRGARSRDREITGQLGGRARGALNIAPFVPIGNDMRTSIDRPPARA